MTTSTQEMRTAVIALLALTLARCSEEAGPTGWIPSNGVISGVIAPASDLQASARAAPAAARAVGRAIRAHLAAVTPAGVTVAGVSPAILAAKVRVADTTERDAVAVALRRDPVVAAVTRNRLIWRDETAGPLEATAPPSAAASRTIPNDPFFPFQSWHYGLIDLPRAWSITKGSSAVLVAVVDDGIRFDHPAIAANLAPDGYDFVSTADSVLLCSGGMISNAADGDGPDPDPTIPA